MKYYLYPLVAKNKDGGSVLLYSRGDFLRFLGQINVYSSLYYSYSTYWNRFTTCYNFDHFDGGLGWIVKDDAGKSIDVEDLTFYLRELGYSGFEAYTERKRPSYFFQKTYDAEFRNGPVPMTGKRRCSSFMRSRPDGLKRESSLMCDGDDFEGYDGQVKFRKKRKQYVRFLLDYDGMERSDWRDRNWKKNRKTQWKG